MASDPSASVPSLDPAGTPSVVPDVDQASAEQFDSESDTTASPRAHDSPTRTAVSPKSPKPLKTRPFSPSFSYPAEFSPRAAQRNGNLLSPTLAAAQDPQTQLQVINEDQDFNQEFNDYMRHVWHLADSGFDYNLVAVFGSQSTGKSTLLNRLFGTQFAVMHEEQRQQTTKGIWISKGQNMNVLIMDVEGTDGRERGEDQEFERKSALFSLATAEVLIVNMWENMVGLYNGANMGLLKTVFEVNLQLFHDRNSRKGKTLLLFVIRDHVSKTSLDSLAEAVQQDLNRIWSELSKPEGLEQCVIGDYFDFMFTSLPHKLLQQDNFNRQVDQLRHRFMDPSHPAYVFKSEYHKRIPADGFPKYAESIWEKIVTNRDLDLPTQQELLAQYRCDEIASAVFDAFAEAIQSLKPPLEAGRVVDNLGTQMDDHRRTALAHFDKNAGRYHSEVYQRKRREHLAKLNSELHLLFLAQVKNLAKQSVRQFRESLKQRLAMTTDQDFSTVIVSAKAQALDQFNEQARQAILDETEWAFTAEAEQLDQELQLITDQLKQEELNRLMRRLEKSVQNQYTDAVSSVLNEPHTGMWGELLSQFFAINESKEQLLRKRATGLQVPTEELDQLVTQFRLVAWEAFCQRIHDDTSEQMMLVRLRSCLEDRFRYDDQGLPRVWKPGDDIDGQFNKAKDSMSQLIPLFNRIDIEGYDLKLDDYLPASFDVRESLELLTAGKQKELAKRFKREADALYVEAKRSVVATTARVPYWIVVLLMFLGWNEFITVITSPVYLILLVTFGTVGYAIYVLNLAGPVQRGAQIVVATASQHVHQLLLEALNRTSPDGTATSAAVTQDPTSSSPHQRSIRRAHTVGATFASSPSSDDIELDDLAGSPSLTRQPSSASFSPVTRQPLRGQASTASLNRPSNSPSSRTDGGYVSDDD
ncbi:Dynamin-like GTPase that mediates homotypic ER fusion [Dimargaris verticillata]|uniref:Dynamin-like GTPase that mediates homotypic ER fusion n=1 Tax=Dimargaris verticillata TaxID=2761393 RepID=A0A9W8B891_9FUNG|nr:Dynamin-like GTPase that mediates homotypic ER fusion [Dimargaris verticillata]